MRCFVDVDLCQAEWVVTAFLAQDPRMLEVVYKRLDPHVTTGMMISNGAPMSFIKHEAKLIGHHTDPTTIYDLRSTMPKEWEGLDTRKFFFPRNMSIRQAGKKSNHGLNYNMQYKRFALENGMEEKDAARIVQIYRNVAYPGLKKYYEYVELRLRKDGRRLTNCYGQTRKFLDRWGPNLLDAAYAFLPQSTVGNIAGLGWRRIYSDTQSLKKVEPVAQVHDSVTTQHTFDSLEELRDQVEAIVSYMAIPFTYHQREFTILREVKIGTRWDAEAMKEVPVSDEGGIEVDELTAVWEGALAA